MVKKKRMDGDKGSGKSVNCKKTQREQNKSTL